MQQADSGRAYSLANAVSLVAALSLLSPVLGLVMEISLAWRFGASPTVDAFRTAYLLIGFGNQIFIGFLLPHLVVPMLAEYRARGQEQTGWRIAMTFGQSIAMAELFSPNYVNPCFWKLSTHGNLNYRYLLGTGSISEQGEPFLVRDNLEVDLEQLKSLLKELTP